MWFQCWFPGIVNFTITEKNRYLEYIIGVKGPQFKMTKAQNFRVAKTLLAQTC